MSGPVARVFLAVVLGWVAWGAAALVLPGPLSLAIGGAAGGLAVALARGTLVIGGLMALLEPLGVVLPLLVLRQAAGALGWPVPAFSSGELLGFLALHVAFLAASMGVLPADPYRLGYAPWPVACMVLLLCAYGLITGNWFVPLVAVAGQALWVAGAGSSNWFDHVLHAALVPVVAAVLILRVLG